MLGIHATEETALRGEVGSQLLGLHIARLGLNRVYDVDAEVEQVVDNRIDGTARVVNDLQPVTLGVVNQPLGPREDIFAQLFGRDQQSVLAAEVIADEYRIEVSLRGLVENLATADIEVGDAVNDGTEHLRGNHHREQGILHAEGRAGILEVCCPHDTHAGTIFGSLHGQTTSLGKVDVLLGVGPGECIDQRRVGHILEEARSGQRALILRATLAALGKGQRATDVVGRGIVVGNRNGVDVVVNLAFQRIDRVHAEVGKEFGEGRWHGESQPGGGAVDRLSVDSGEEAFAVGHHGSCNC